MKSDNNKILKTINRIFTFVALILYVLVIYLPFLHPELIPHLNFIGIATLPILLLFIAIIIINICHRNILLSLVTIISLLICFPTWRNTFVFNIPDEPNIAGHSTQLHLLSYNLHDFTYADSSPDSILSFVSHGNFDIVCFQEYHDTRLHSGKFISSSLDSIFPYSHFGYGLRNHGIALFSRYPIIDKPNGSFGGNIYNSVFTDILVNDDTIRIINNHLESTHLNDEERAITSKLSDNKDDSIYNTTYGLLKHLASSSVNRAPQADSVAALIARTSYPVIIMGDFNDIPQSYAYHRIISSENHKLHDAYAAAGRWLYYWTYNDHCFFLPIDHIIVSDDFKILDAHIDYVKFSDHNPISAIVEL